MAYSASKGGVRSLTLPLARELGPLQCYIPCTKKTTHYTQTAEYGIRVNAVAPAPFESAMTEFLSEEDRAGFAREYFFPKRFGTGEEFARTVQYLIECTYVNGETITLNAAMAIPTKPLGF